MPFNLKKYALQKNIPFFDVCFAETMAKNFGNNSEELKIILLLLSLKISSGDLLIKLNHTEQKNYQNFISNYEAPDTLLTDKLNNIFPEIKNIILENSSLTGTPGEIKPLILEGDNLYLFKFYVLERELIKDLNKRLETLRKPFNPLLAEKAIEYTTETVKKSGLTLSSQFKKGIRQILTKNISLVTGGPGTGKTTLIFSIISSFLYMAEKPEEFKIILCAPTGKAADRMKQAIILLKEKIHDNSAEYFPDESMTLHRLLEIGRKTRAKKIINANLIIIDEASMAGIDVMAELLKRIPPDCRLIFIGDSNQLPAVKGGALFQDLIADKSDDSHRLKNHTIYLKKSYRSDQSISDCANSLINNDFSSFINSFSPFSEPLDHSKPLILLENTLKSLPLFLPEMLNDLFKPQAEHKTLPGYQNKFRILCATRKGSGSVEHLNALITEYYGFSTYPFKGLPIIITENDYENRLFNGTTGTIVHDDQGELKAVFQADNQELIYLPLEALKSYQPAFALTIHQSQGSEYDRVIINLPDYKTPLLTKELLYTALTRARKQVILCTEKEPLQHCFNNTIRRFSSIKKNLCKPI